MAEVSASNSSSDDQIAAEYFKLMSAVASASPHMSLIDAHDACLEQAKQKTSHKTYQQHKAKLIKKAYGGFPESEQIYLETPTSFIAKDGSLPSFETLDTLDTLVPHEPKPKNPFNKPVNMYNVPIWNHWDLVILAQDSQEVQSFLPNKKIQAIKALRDISGGSLLATKEAIEDIGGECVYPSSSYYPHKHH